MSPDANGSGEPLPVAREAEFIDLTPSTVEYETVREVARRCPFAVIAPTHLLQRRPSLRCIVVAIPGDSLVYSIEDRPDHQHGPQLSVTGGPGLLPPVFTPSEAITTGVGAIAYIERNEDSYVAYLSAAGVHVQVTMKTPSKETFLSVVRELHVVDPEQPPDGGVTAEIGL